ncbi:MAG: YegS/Rv2252/BmrU family lipid kinase [Saprospiraceae bacterium]|nr:YegS/Rv2252/BmrU family lipid kinase [Saprospiraceae bacterium]
MMGSVLHEDNHKNIAILCYEKAGNGKSVKISTQVFEILQMKNVPSTLFINEWPDSVQNFSEIWIGGGDGTIHYYINTYKNFDLPIALLGGGTGNDLTKYLYGDENIESRIEKLLVQNIIEIDMGNCNGQYYVNSLGIGFDGDVLQNMNSIRKIGGHLGYLLAVIKSIFSFKEIRFEIKYHNTVKTIHPVILAVSNSTMTGGGFLIAPKASLQDGKLDLLFTEPLPWWKRLWVLPKVEKGKHIGLPYVYHHHADTVEIKTNKDVYYQIDGELKMDSGFLIKISPEKLKINCSSFKLYQSTTQPY